MIKIHNEQGFSVRCHISGNPTTIYPGQTYIVSNDKELENLFSALRSVGFVMEEKPKTKNEYTLRRMTVEDSLKIRNKIKEEKISEDVVTTPEVKQEENTSEDVVTTPEVKQEENTSEDQEGSKPKRNSGKK